MIIAVKDKDTAYVAVSVECTFFAVHTEDILHEDNLKMWHPQGRDNCIMAITSVSDICCDRLRYADIAAFDKPLDSAVMLREIVPAIQKVYGNLLDDGRLWHEIVVAKDDRLFNITPNFTVCEIEDFEALGYPGAEDIAFGVLEANRDLPPVERIAEAFRTIEEGTANRHFPIVVMNTKTDERIIIDR